MLATFNPNSNVISKKIIQMASWKQLAKQSPKDYLKLETSKVYDSFNGGKGCTLAIKNKDGSIFNPWCIVAEAKYAYVNGNFAPLSTGPYAANSCNDKAERSLDVLLGDITERLQSHLRRWQPQTAMDIVNRLQDIELHIKSSRLNNQIYASQSLLGICLRAPR